MNKILRLWAAPLRITSALRRMDAPSVSFSAPTAPHGFSHRPDVGGAAAATDILTKLTVVLLSSVNAVMWWAYTESRLMGAVWAMIAIFFAAWIKRDAARR